MESTHECMNKSIHYNADTAKQNGEQLHVEQICCQVQWIDNTKRI